MNTLHANDESQVTTESSEQVVVRRNAWLSGLVAALSALVGAGYLLRGGSWLETVVGIALLALAVLHATGLWSARTPVLVADRHGIRLRVGTRWRGLPWGSMRQVVVEHADSVLREGRLVVVPRDPAAALDDVGVLGSLHLRWNRLWYGAALSVPLGATTLTDHPDLAAGLTALADGRSDVVQLRGRRLAQLDEVEGPGRAATPGDENVVVELPPPPEDELDAQDEPIVPTEPAVPPVEPVRALRDTVRAEVRLDVPAIVPAQRQAEGVDRDGESTWRADADNWGEPIELPIEVEADDLTVRPPVEPVIGPRIARARDMLDMSIEELSERTRIRPHVLEAIEVDDFGPCGGDFYARGHLTAITRVLGLDLEPLMALYDERYAHGPINARRVFEAELATGLSSGMSATRGGPRWTLMIGAVLCLAMVWGLARLVAGDPQEQLATPPTAGSGDTAGLAANREPITSPLMRTSTIRLTAAHAGTRVVVRDRTGRILWSGALPMGKQRKVVGLAPFKVEADNAGAVTVTVNGKDRGTMGVAGEAATRRFR